MNATLKDLINDINNSNKNEYIFLKVLHNNDDIHLFISKIPENYYNDIIATKKIKIKLWIQIMNRIEDKLSINYIIYRKTYYHEKYGNRQQLTNYLHPMYYFFKKEKEKVSIFQLLNCCMKSEPFYRILLYENKMENFEFGTKYYRSDLEGYSTDVVVNMDELY